MTGEGEASWAQWAVRVESCLSICIMFLMILCFPQQFAVPFSYYHLTYVVLVFNLVCKVASEVCISV